jgi:hypothetical protein
MPANFDFTPAPKARRLAFSAFTVTLLFCLIGQLNITLSEVTWPLTFLPCIGIFLWPKGANAALSLCLIFLLGLLHDQASFGPVGFWPLIWICFFLFYRPDARSRQNELGALWLRFTFWILIIVGIHILVGLVVTRLEPRTAFVLIAALTVVVLFPAIWILRKFIIRLVDANDELGILS